MLECAATGTALGRLKRKTPRLRGLFLPIRDPLNMTTNSVYEEYSKIISIAKKVNSDKFDSLLKVFERSVSKLVSFNSRVGTIAHICVYLRNIRFLKKIVDKFDDPKRLMEWLSEKDEKGLTAINLVERFEFQEMYIYMNKIVTESRERDETCVLKRGVLNKYVNIVNGYNERYLILTIDSLFYGKKMVLDTMTELKLGEVYFEHHSNMKKFKLVSKHDSTTYVFKGLHNEDISDWICLFQNVIASYDREFYMHNFVFKVISDASRSVDDRLYKLLKMTNLFPFYTRDNRLYIESGKTDEGTTQTMQDSSIHKDEHLNNSTMAGGDAEAQPGEADAVAGGVQEEGAETRPRNESRVKEVQKELELFSLESEDDTEYEFFEAKDQQG